MMAHKQASAMVRAGYWRLMVPALAFVISVGLQPAGLLNAQQTAWEVPESPPPRLLQHR